MYWGVGLVWIRSSHLSGACHRHRILQSGNKRSVAGTRLEGPGIGVRAVPADGFSYCPAALREHRARRLPTDLTACRFNRRAGLCLSEWQVCKPGIWKSGNAGKLQTGVTRAPLQFPRLTGQFSVSNCRRSSKCVASYRDYYRRLASVARCRTATQTHAHIRAIFRINGSELACARRLSKLTDL